MFCALCWVVECVLLDVAVLRSSVVLCHAVCTVLIQICAILHEFALHWSCLNLRLPLLCAFDADNRASHTDTNYTVNILVHPLLYCVIVCGILNSAPEADITLEYVHGYRCV
jgi:hypothetical protein